MGGRKCESTIARNFQISINELIAFQINGEAKFTKVFREGINKCFLIPAEFKDDARRKFFKGRFKEFVNDSVNPRIYDGDHINSSLTDRYSNALEKADFAEEHRERREIELEYAKCNGISFVDVEETDVSLEFSTQNHDKLSNDDSHPISDDIDKLEQDGSGINSSAFNRELKKARKHFIDNREVCLLDRKVRDDARELLEKLCADIKEIISGNYAKSESKEEGAQISRKVAEANSAVF